MSFAIQCDNPPCGKVVSSDSPDGWLSVKVKIEIYDEEKIDPERVMFVGGNSSRSSGPPPTRKDWLHKTKKRFHFCSIACLGKALGFRTHDSIAFYGEEERHKED